ncbi:AI-2E family transporter [Isosphaeraceae bacterium EP7]
MNRGTNYGTASLVTLAVLAVMAALYLMKVILIPIALALLLACLLSPITSFLRRVLPLGPIGAAVMLFLLAAFLGLYGASLTAESLVQAGNSLPADVERLSGGLSDRISDMIRDKPYLRGILPEPGTIDVLGDANRNLLIDKLSYGLADLTWGVAQGFIVLVLVLFLLAEGELLSPKLVRFFAPTSNDAASAQATLNDLTRQIRAFLVARTLINLGLGVVFALILWALGVKFPFALGLLAGLLNFIPYVGQAIGGGLPALVALGQSGAIGDGLIVAAVFLGLAGVEGYIITPMVLGRSLDLNGTTILIACLFWGFLWGLVGLIVAMPLTVCMKLVFQNVPEMYRWAELMSKVWHSPLPDPRLAGDPTLDGSGGAGGPTPAVGAGEMISS